MLNYKLFVTDTSKVNVPSTTVEQYTLLRHCNRCYINPVTQVTFPSSGAFMHIRSLLLPLLSMSLLLPVQCCILRKLKNEAEHIRREAQQLHDDTERRLPSSIREAAEIGIMAVDATFRSSLDPQALRFVAVSTATMLAHEAATTIMLQQAKKFDRIFGTNRSEAVCTMLLNTYGYPLIDDIITVSVNRQLSRIDPSFSGDTAAPPLDTIIARHLAAFDLDNAIAIIKGFGSERNTPDYIKAVAERPFNTATYAATRNWKDHGLIYQYRITGNHLEMKRSDETWHPVALPDHREPRIIAADNNRCLVMTTGNELWWYCPVHDQAQWSIELMQTAVKAMSLKPVVGNELCSLFLPHLTRITDSVAAEAAKHNHLNAWAHTRSENYWKLRCRGLLDMALSIDRLLLKSGDGTSFTAADYAAWSRRAHETGAWSNLLSWNSDDIEFHRGGNIPVDSIVDIAIGNWNGTVVTVYVLAMGKIWFIDEEIIHPEWKPVEKWNRKWVVLGKDYEPIANSPYPLDPACRIDAANSVVAVAKPAESNVTLSWIRWDYHQKDDFIYWPIDWCEHEWYTVTTPRSATANFRISTMGTIDPRESHTVWSLPAPSCTFYEPLPDTGYQGVFGSIPPEQISAYPVDLSVSGNNDSVQVFSVKETRMMRKGKGIWKE